ncbi:hypothetical protein SPRG_00058 [Saprolegnia parasitica CBS 223.65]|uniref:VWFA domain-containing protein n=1 Tax=Saprolegnia parasitica (strain CBS 223.65) TaxID=695850 RepID=A0A067D893_SAPPC|nr:hypothetical protein SPRG_00058 [Saprolegnia parasitica CBS 223.65]KDO35212.1 hypothetical protein SPRG_00058 [Saprolegnia parasitica CBS 223.65]|eukprot:XP_012193564.1 hypothetical protein SPRG_00058 [Saprolegnia parasitica CBS 223.65]
MSPLSKTLSVSSAAEHKQIASAETAATTFVNCHIVAPPCEESERKPIDLVVVLDRSGSMSGSKLELCKQTLDFLAHELSPHDRVSLVTYDTYVTTNLRLTKMTQAGKSLLAAKVQGVHAGSCTNLSGGLLAGLEEVQSSSRPDHGEPNPVQSVLLLTDGLANAGISSRSGLVELLEGVLSKNVSLFTFGYGSDHDAELLRELSDLGRGSYYFVQTLDSVSLAFADCLGGLLSVVAQNIKVECVAAANVSIACLKTKRPVTTNAPSTSYTVDLGDICDAWPAAETDQPLVTFSVRYANVLTSSLETTATSVAVGRPVTVTDASLDALVVQQKHRVETAEALEAAQQEAQKGNLRGGQDVLRTLKAKLQRDVAENESFASTTLIDDLDECCAAMETTHVYRERGMQRMAGKTQSHWAQRSNDVEVNAADLCPPPMASAMPMPMQAAQYGNVSKTRMMSKAARFVSAPVNMTPYSAPHTSAS